MPSQQNIQKVVGENTPKFISQIIIGAVDRLEAFRINTFNNGFIFYSILLIILFYILRYIWKLIFD